MDPTDDFPPALFSYSVTPNAVLYTTDPDNPSIVTLQISVNNNTGRNVTCTQLSFTIPVGEDPGDLTNDPSSITANAAQGTGWDINPDDTGNFTAVPYSEAQLDAEGSIAFILKGVKVNRYAGLVEVRVQEYGDTTRQGYIGINKVMSVLAITNFTADHVTVAPGKQVTLAWTTTGAQGVTLSWPGRSVTRSTNGQYIDTPQDTTVYTLAATGAGQTITQQITVVVPTVKILSFGAEPREVPQDGQSILSWEIANANEAYLQAIELRGGGESTLAAELEEAMSGLGAASDAASDHIELREELDNAKSGTMVVKPQLPTAYFLTAKGYGRTDSRPALVEVKPVVINTFTSSPAQVWLGEEVTLQWDTEWATECSIDQGIGLVPPSGLKSITPLESATYTYTLTARGFTPQSATARVDVRVPIIRCFGFIMERSDPSTVLLKWEADAPEVTLEVVSNPQHVQPTGSYRIVTRDRAMIIAVLTAGRGEHQVQAVARFWQANAVPELTAYSDKGINTPQQDVTLKWRTPNHYGGGAVISGSGETWQLPSGGEDTLVFKPGGPDSKGEVWESYLKGINPTHMQFSTGIVAYAMGKSMPRQEGK